MSDNLFNRRVQVTCWRESVPADPTLFNPLRIGDSLVIKDLRVQFKVERSLTKTPNACDVTITNLAEHNRTDLTTKPLYVQLDAGYEDAGVRLLYTGDLRFGMSEQKGPEWETLLQLGDGDCHHQWSRVNRTYPANTSVRTVLADCARAFGFPLPANLANDTRLDQPFPTGTSTFGPTRDEISRLLLPFGYTWSIQNNNLQILRTGDISATEPIILEQSTGMIGSPTYGSPPKSGKPPHMNVKMMLYPEIGPGQLVQVNSKAKKGLFKVDKVVHKGDTHGEAWYSEIEIVPYTAANDNPKDASGDDGPPKPEAKAVAGTIDLGLSSVSGGAGGSIAGAAGGISALRR